MSESHAADLAPLQRIGVFGYSMTICRLLVSEMQRQRLFQPHKKCEQPYIDAEVRMLTEDPANIDKYLSGWRVYYKNKQTDGKGKLTKCDAYLMPQ